MWKFYGFENRASFAVEWQARPSNGSGLFLLAVAFKLFYTVMQISQLSDKTLKLVISMKVLKYQDK